MSTGKYRKESNCLNCGHHVDEHFCTHCGQENIEIKEDALHMITHAVADYFHFESKFFRTIKPLMLHPGTLSRLYVSGKRVVFIHPIRLYIFISIVFFLFMLGSSKSEKMKHEQETEAATQKEAQAEVEQSIAKLKKELKDAQLTTKQMDSLISVTVVASKKEKTNLNDFTINENWVNKNDTTVSAYENRQNALPSKKRDNFLKHYVIRKNLELRKYPNVGEKIEEDIKHNAPKMMFILLPLFALLLKLVYIRSKRYYYEHLIYSFHIHSALFLSLLIVSAVSAFFDLFFSISVLLSTLWMIYFIWYIYRSLRTFYGSRRWVTVAKLAFLAFGYLMVFSFSSIIVIAVTMIML